MDALRLQIAAAIHSVRSQVRWKPGSAARHLQKRKMRGHLPAGATLDDYEHVIQAILEDARAEVYAYWYEGTPYVAIVAVFQERCWRVMFSLGGLMESAYVVEHPEQYLSQSAFERLGSLSEVLA